MHTHRTRDEIRVAMQSIGEQKSILLVTTAHGVPAAEICILSGCSKVNTRNQPLAGHRVFCMVDSNVLDLLPIHGNGSLH